MAEALAGIGVAANVIAVIQISEHVISACYQYFRTIKDAKQDILDIINIVGGLKTTLENVGLLNDYRSSSMTMMVKAIYHTSSPSTLL